MIKIDAVISWVDGSDPVLNAKRAQYTDAKSLRHNDEAAPTRFASLGEIFWCVASINRFAPFINRIYIVTDGQDPCLEPFLEEYFPSHIPVEIVDHKVIFKGFEEFLPVFNSRSIESMVWRIPGLSEHFVLLNDDFIITKPLSVSDFYTADGKALCYGERFSTLWGKVLTRLKKRPDGRQVATFKSSFLKAVEIAGGSPFFYYLRHTPRPLFKSFYESFFSEHPEVLKANLNHRFRDASQFNAQELQYLFLTKEGKCKCMTTKRIAFFMQPKRKPHYVSKKIQKLRSGEYRFCCFNSLDTAAEEDRRLVYEWVSELLEIQVQP